MRQEPTATLVAKCRRAAKAATRTSDIAHGQALDAQAVEAGYASWHELLRAFRVRAAAATAAGGSEGAAEVPPPPPVPQDHDAWFRRQVQASIDDPRPNVPDEVVRAAARLKREQLTARAAIALPLDPKLRKGFYSTRNEHRSKREIDAWWDVPFAVTNPDGSLDVRCLDGGAWDRPTFYGHAADMSAAVALAAEKLTKWLGYRCAPVASMTDDGLYEAVLMPQRPDDDLRVISEPMSAEALKNWLDARKV